MKSRYLWLILLTSAIHLIGVYLLLRHEHIALQLTTFYAVGMLIVLFAFAAGSGFWIKFFKLVAILACVLLPFSFLYGFMVMAEQGPALLVFLTGLAAQVIMVLAYKLDRKRPARFVESGDLDPMLNEISDNSLRALTEQRLQAQRGRAMKAEMENITFHGRIRDLEDENERLRAQVAKLRTILADPFHDPIPMEEMI